jgi:hypothetical protein
MSKIMLGDTKQRITNQVIHEALDLFKEKIFYSTRVEKLNEYHSGIVQRQIHESRAHFPLSVLQDMHNPSH